MDSSDGHLKRTACQLFTQLPEDKREALLVLRYVRQLIFCLGEEWETVSRSAPILPFSTERPTGQGGFLRALKGGQTGPLDKPNQE